MSYSPRYVAVTGKDEIGAVVDGDIEGDVYKDGEVYAERASLNAWRMQQIPVSEGTQQ